MENVLCLSGCKWYAAVNDGNTVLSCIPDMEGFDLCGDALEICLPGVNSDAALRRLLLSKKDKGAIVQDYLFKVWKGSTDDHFSDGREISMERFMDVSDACFLAINELWEVLEYGLLDDLA